MTVKCARAADSISPHRALATRYDEVTDKEDRMDIQHMLDEYEVRRVRQIWAFARDHGEWETMRSCFHPDAMVCVAWYTGPVATFLERTMAMSSERRPEELSKHWIGNSRVSVNGDRAILET